MAWFALGSLLLSALAFPMWWRGRGARLSAASRAWLGRSRAWWLSALLLLVPALLMWGWVAWRPIRRMHSTTATWASTNR